MFEAFGNTFNPAYKSHTTPTLDHRLSTSLRELLRKDVMFVWEQKHHEAFHSSKRLCSLPKSLCFHGFRKGTIVCADASSYGQRSLLLQKQASRSLNDTEKHYAQIENKALAITWVCERFLTI